MQRVIVALCGMAAAFAALAIWLDLGRGSGTTGWAALGVFVGVLLIGFPALRYCCKHRLWEIWHSILLGILCGGLCTLPFADGPFGFGFLLTIFLLAGTVFGLLFWLMAIWRNDDLTCPKSFCLPCGRVYKVARNALRRRNLIQSK
jgi:hypothetical protein